MDPPFMVALRIATTAARQGDTPCANLWNGTGDDAPDYYMLGTSVIGDDAKQSILLTIKRLSGLPQRACRRVRHRRTWVASPASGSSPSRPAGVDVRPSESRTWMAAPFGPAASNIQIVPPGPNAPASVRLKSSVGAVTRRDSPSRVGPSAPSAGDDTNVVSPTTRRRTRCRLSDSRQPTTRSACVANAMQHRSFAESRSIRMSDLDVCETLRSAAACFNRLARRSELATFG